MPHLLTNQLRFARSELMRCLDGVSEEDASRRIGPMNCISWIVGHLANQEHRYWVERAQGRSVVSGLNDLVGSGKPASTPSLTAMWAIWRSVTAEADAYLDALTPSMLATYLVVNGRPLSENICTLLMRNIFHYWFHIGEAHAIRQMLGHEDLPQFIGDLPPYGTE